MIEGAYCYVDFYTAVERRQVFLKQLSLWLERFISLQSPNKILTCVKRNSITCLVVHRIKYILILQSKKLSF